LRWFANFAALVAADTDDTLMDSCFNRVILLDVDLRQLVAFDARGFFDVTKGGSFHNIANNESFDGLVFRDGLAS